MQIGLCLPHFGRALETGRLLQVAQRADARGLDSLWVTDHVIVPKDVPRGAKSCRSTSTGSCGCC
jgi:alkanesulfonate monooxygenase SsuD/methylene tetrahydromethanopterin reductase-like flavin-dependent oxidoreductase (luciferase family)